jgi:hypothetical protein
MESNEHPAIPALQFGPFSHTSRFTTPEAYCDDVEASRTSKKCPNTALVNGLYPDFSCKNASVYTHIYLHLFIGLLCSLDRATRSIRDLEISMLTN